MRKNIFFILLLSAIFYSCEEILLEDDISEESVSLTAPFDDAQFNSTSITFYWELVESATQYRLQIARPDFDNPLEIVVDVLVEANSSSQQLNIGNYQWRVQAVNSSYETPYATRSLSIVSNTDFQNNSVILVSPENNRITNTASQVLSWQNVIGATSYQLQIYNTSNVVVFDETLTATNYNYSFPQGDFNWRVRASNGTQQTMYTNRSILVDTTPPNTPVTTLPTNNAFLDENEVAFQWTRSAINGSVETDSIYIYNNNTLTDLELRDQAISPFTDTLETGVYYWFIKSFDEAGNVSAQSTVVSFTIN